jgi:hypothetical protein
LEFFSTTNLLKTQNSHNLAMISDKAAKRDSNGDTGKDERDEGECTGNRGESGALWADMVEATTEMGVRITVNGTTIGQKPEGDRESRRTHVALDERTIRVPDM